MAGILEAYLMGKQARRTEDAAQQVNAMREFIGQNGAAIFGGDQNALGQLATMGPEGLGAAMEMRGQMEARAARQSDAARAAREWAERQDAATVAAEVEKTNRLLKGAAYFHARGDRAGYEGFVRQNGGDPADFPFESFPALAAQAGEVLEVWQGFQPQAPDPLKGAPTGYMFNDPGNPAAGVAPLPGYERSPGVVVNTGDMGVPQPQIGTIPQGFVAVPKPDTPAGFEMMPIPGGPEDRTRSDAAQANARDVSTETIVTAASRARAAAGDRVTGNLGQGVAQNVPFTASAETMRQVNVLKATAKIENLQAMRAASPTGGALGAVTAPELVMLEDKAGALDPSSPNFLRDLDDYERTLLRTIHGPEEGDRIFEATREGQAPPPGAASAVGAPPQTFLSNPAVTRAAQGAGVSPEELWQYLSDEDKAELSK